MTKLGKSELRWPGLLLSSASNEPSGCLQTFGDCRESQKPRPLGRFKFDVPLLAAGFLTLLIIGMLAGCGKKQTMITYEGGNVSLDYDGDAWSMICHSSVEYPVFGLNRDDISIMFMALEGSGGIVEGFHDTITSLMVMAEENAQVQELDVQREEPIWCYTDLITGREDLDDSCLICYGKTDGEWLILAMAEFTAEDSDEKNEAKKQDVMKILDSLRISYKAEVGEVEETEGLQFFYDIAMDLKKYGVNSRETGEEEETALSEDADGTKEADAGAKEEDAMEEEGMISDEEAASLQYVEKVMLKLFYGEGDEEYPLYAPIGSENSNDMIWYYDHGLQFSAYATDNGSAVFMYEFFEESTYSQVSYWEEREEYFDVQVGEVVSRGADRYRLASAKTKDYAGVPFVTKKFSYLDVQEKGVSVLWELELTETSIDAETEKIVDEIAKCYRLDLDEMKTGGEWHEGTQKERERSQDQYEPEDEDLALAEVDGYQYMGLTTLYSYDRSAHCPVLAPMGRKTTVRESSIYASMHGVHVSLGIESMFWYDYMSLVKVSSDNFYESKEKNERIRNVWRSEIIMMPEYEREASYVVLTYEEKDYSEEKYIPHVDINCYIRIDEENVLIQSITLNYGEYDNSTNTLLGELETAYGVDLSRYYYEKK